jgi:hypothetical protein
MFATSRYGWMMASLAVVASTTGLSCVCPPCANGAATPVAGGSNATTAQASSSSSSGSSTSSTSTKTESGGNRLVIWDGDGHSAGAGAKGWADCDKKPDCKSTLAAASGSGKDGSTGLKLFADGPGWKGGGWNWFGWWPETSGTDLSTYKNLSFWMRIDAKTPDMMPDPGAVTVLLGCSKGKTESQSVSMDKYGKELSDGKWHKIVVPVAELTRDKPKFDLATAWEFRLGIWTADPRTVSIYVDDIAAEN